MLRKLTEPPPMTTLAPPPMIDLPDGQSAVTLLSDSEFVSDSTTTPS
jgi:hypothetical protein